MVIGIDIGTSYSCVSYLKNGIAEKVKPGTEKDYSVPSAVYAEEEGPFLIGMAALQKRAKNPARFKDNFKRDFGTEKPYVLGGRGITPDEIYTEYFRYFKHSIESLTGKTVSKTYITHPVGYNKAKKDLMERCANHAGLMDVTLIDEPTAAMLNFFGDHKPKNGDKVLVYDLGGGTLDLTLGEMQGDGLRLLTQPVGDITLGGADFDAILYNEIVSAFSRQKDLSKALRSVRFTNEIILAAIQAKHSLSRDVSTTVQIPIGLGEYLEHTVTRERFEALLEPRMQASDRLIEKIAANAGIAPQDIDHVLCVGGSTRVPYVTARIEKIIGKPVLKTADPELAVCMGAALRHCMDLENEKTPKPVPEIKKVEIKETPVIPKKVDIKPFGLEDAPHMTVKTKARPADDLSAPGMLTVRKKPTENPPAKPIDRGALTKDSLENYNFIASAADSDFLYGISKDGKEKRCILRQPVKDPQYHDGYVYYLKKQEGGIFRFHILSGREEKLLAAEPETGFGFAGSTRLYMANQTLWAFTDKGYIAEITYKKKKDIFKETEPGYGIMLMSLRETGGKIWFETGTRGSKIKIFGKSSMSGSGKKYTLDIKTGKIQKE